MTEQATAEASAIQAIFRKPLNKGAFEILNAGREDTTQRAMVVGVYPHKNHSVTVDDIVESVMNDALPIARSIMPALRKAHEVNLSACTQRTQLVELLYQRIYLREIQTRQMVYLMPPARLQRTRGAETPAHELYGRDFHPEQHRAVIGCLRHTFNGERKQAILAWSDLDHGEPSGSLGNFAKENLFVLNLFCWASPFEHRLV